MMINEGVFATKIEFEAFAGASATGECFIKCDRGW